MIWQLGCQRVRRVVLVFGYWRDTTQELVHLFDAISGDEEAGTLRGPTGHPGAKHPDVSTLDEKRDLVLVERVAYRFGLESRRESGDFFKVHSDIKTTP